MKFNFIINVVEATLFRRRLAVLVFFILTSIFLLFQATQIKLDAAFTKHIPLKSQLHENVS